MKLIELHEDFDRYAIHDLKNPSDETKGAETPEKIVEIIKTHCKSMLKAYQETGIVLYRGVSGAESATKNVETIISGIRPDRKAVTLNRNDQKVIVDYMKSRGLKVTRGNCLFTSASSKIASDWGGTYAVFVKDGWTAQAYDWGEKQDFYSYNVITSIISNLVNAQHTEDEVKMKKTLSDRERKSLLKLAQDARERADRKFDSLMAYEFSDTATLVKTLKEQPMEILFIGDSYIGIRAKDFPKYAKMLGITISNKR